MNKSAITKILLGLFVIVGFYFYFNGSSSNIDDTLIDNTDYSTLGINPNDYKTLTGFLLELPSMSGSIVEGLDLLNDNFVLINSHSGSLGIRTPLYNKDIKGDRYNDLLIKNSIIAEIYKAYKNGLIQGGIGTNIATKIIFENDVNHNETQVVNDIFNLKLNINDIISELGKVGNISQPKKELLAYLNELKGDYDESNKIRKELIYENKKLIRHLKEIIIKGTVLTQNGTPIPGAKITFLNKKNIETVTNINGEYELKFKYYNFSHLRFKASYNGFSDGYSTFQFNTYLSKSWKKVIESDFHLKKAEKTYSININDPEIITERAGNKYFTVKSSQSEYRVPYKGLVDINFNPYTGEDIDVHLYEFTKYDKIDNLVSSDTFGPVYGYLGNMMKTFGMPYIQFFDKKTGNELFVKKSTPMILKNNIYHMQELYDNHDKIYEELTKDDMKWLVQKSKELRGFPFNQDFIQENNMLRFPAWWALDRKKGVWENIGFRVLTEDGLVELPFYSINDID